MNEVEFKIIAIKGVIVSRNEIIVDYQSRYSNYSSTRNVKNDYQIFFTNDEQYSNFINNFSNSGWEKCLPIKESMYGITMDGGETFSLLRPLNSNKTYKY